MYCNCYVLTYPSLWNWAYSIGYNELLYNSMQKNNCTQQMIFVKSYFKIDFNGYILFCLQLQYFKQKLFTRCKKIVCKAIDVDMSFQRNSGNNFSWQKRWFFTSHSSNRLVCFFFHITSNYAVWKWMRVKFLIAMIIFISMHLCGQKTLWFHVFGETYSDLFREFQQPNLRRTNNIYTLCFLTK